MDHYERNAYISPFWTGDTVVNESLFPVAEADGSVADLPLLYPAVALSEVRSAGLDVLYRPGKDYILADGKLRLLPGGAIPVMPHDRYFPAEKDPDGKSFGCSLGGHIYFSEGAAIHNRQIAVTYRHNGAWTGFIPCSKAALLPKTTARLASGRPLRVLVYGDSISTGANSSAFVQAAPFAEDWCHMVTGALADRSGSPVTLINTAVGGTDSVWGAAHAPELAAAHHPDLAIIGFGTNDGSRDPAEVAANIARIREAISREAPDCEFLLLSAMLSHKLVSGFYCRQEALLAHLTALENAGTAVANITSVHIAALARKRYFDMTGNNVNHPNDFLARIYAQTILAVIGFEGTK